MSSEADRLDEIRKRLRAALQEDWPHSYGVAELTRCAEDDVAFLLAIIDARGAALTEAECGTNMALRALAEARTRAEAAEQELSELRQEFRCA